MEKQEKTESQKVFKILHKTTSKINFWDRIRVLFGKPVKTTSVISVDKEVTVIESKAVSYVPKFFNHADRQQKKIINQNN